MIDFVKDEFKKQAVIHGEIWMYFIATAKDIIEFCNEKQIVIQAIEAFKITGEGIRPSQENSIYIEPDAECWKNAKNFLDQTKDTEYLYEIWYEGY